MSKSADLSEEARETLAVNIFRVAIEFANLIPQRQHPQVLGVRDFSKKPRFADSNTSKSTSPLRLTDEETQESPTVAGLWVGLTFKTAADHTTTNVGKGGPIEGGVQSILHLKGDQLFKVVAPVNAKAATYYALVEREQTGLSKGLLVPVEHVFFFRQFRDDSATSVESRKAKTGSLVRETCKRFGRQEDITTKNPIITDHFPRRFEANVVARVRQQIEVYEATGNIASIEAAQKCLEELDLDLRERPGYTNSALHNFISRSTPSESIDTKLVIEEVEAIWPELKALELTETEVLSLAKAIRRSHLVVEYRFIRHLVVSFTISSRRTGHDAVEDIVKTLVQDAALSLGTHTVSDAYVPPPRTGLAGFVAAEAESLRAIVHHSREKREALENALGPKIINDSIEELAKKLANSTDADSARTYVSQLHQYSVQQLNAFVSDIEGKVDQHVKYLETCAEILKEEESTSGDA